MHIGTPKTGTTQLQRWLRANEEVLSAEGIALSSALRQPNNRLLSTMFCPEPDKILRKWGAAGPGDRDRFRAELTRAFDAELARKRSGHATMILTCEHLYRDLTDADSIERLKIWLNERFEDVQVVCYLREQSAFHRSQYANRLRKGSSAGIDERMEETNLYARYDYRARIADWERSFGFEALTLRIYDRQKLLDGDIRTDFLAAVLPDLDRSRMTFDRDDAKRSLTHRQSMLALAVNRCFPEPQKDMWNTTPRRLKERLVALPFLDEGPPVPHPRAREIYERMDASNVQFFERYFGRRENLFAPPPEDEYPTEALSYTEAEVEQIIEAICATDGLLVLDRGEIRQLSRLADELDRAGTADVRMIMLLLSIVHRCDPHDERTARRMEGLRRRLFAADFPE